MSFLSSVDLVSLPTAAMLCSDAEGQGSWTRSLGCASVAQAALGWWALGPVSSCSSGRGAALGSTPGHRGCGKQQAVRVLSSSLCVIFCLPRLNSVFFFWLPLPFPLLLIFFFPVSFWCQDIYSFSL